MKIEDIKVLLDTYERTMNDRKMIEETAISDSLKKQIISEIDGRLVILKNEILLNIYNMEGPRVSFSAIERSVSVIEQPLAETDTNELAPEQSFPEWKEWIWHQAEVVFNHDVRYVNTKAVLKAIYEYMAGTYSVCWKQENREWRQKNSGTLHTLDVIYAKSSLRELFESILETRVDKAVLEHPENVSLEEVVEPLCMYYGKHKDREQIIRSVFDDMGTRFNISWDRYRKRYMSVHTVRSAKRSEIVCWDHGLSERFRQSADFLLTEIKEQKEIA